MITTDNKERPIISWSDLEDFEKEDFDWVEYSEILSKEDLRFVRYDNTVICLSDMLHTSHHEGWDGIMTDSAFSGYLIKICDDGEHVICGYICV